MANRKGADQPPTDTGTGSDADAIRIRSRTGMARRRGGLVFGPAWRIVRRDEIPDRAALEAIMTDPQLELRELAQRGAVD